MLQFLYLPRSQNCPVEFLQQVLKKEKSVLNQNQVKQLQVPCWAELSPKKIWATAMQLPQFADYIPSTWTAESKLLERPFFYGILVSLAPDYVTALIKDCREQRAQLVELSKAVKPLAGVRIDATWMEELLADGFVSSKYPPLPLTFHLPQNTRARPPTS